MIGLARNAAVAQRFPIKMVLAADHATPAPGLTPTATISRNGAAFAAGAGAVTAIGNGWYYYAPAGTDLDVVGFTVVRLAAATADDAHFVAQVVPWQPENGTNLGLLSLPFATVGNAGGLITRGPGSGQIEPSGGNIALSTAGLTALFSSHVLPEAYPADGSPGTLAALLYLIIANLTQFDVAGSSLVARKLDGATAAAGYLLDDAVNPTSRERVS